MSEAKLLVAKEIKVENNEIKNIINYFLLVYLFL